MKSKKQLEKEVKADIENNLKIVKDLKLSRPVMPDDAKSNPASALAFLEQEKTWLKICTSEEMANWLIDQTQSYIKTINQICPDFMSGNDFDDRYQILLFMNNLNNCLWIRDINVISKDVEKILMDKKEVDLVVILSIMGYV